jgi:putative mRNA 3-end processing factor
VPERVRADQSGGVLVEAGGQRFALDVGSPTSADLYFYSHAHSDHLGQPRSARRVVASKETVVLAKARGFNLRATDSDELYDTGHILGSRGILLRDSIYYTGDIAGKPRGFLRKATPVKCKTLIIEATYGNPSYRFPPIARVVEETNRLIDSQFSMGRPVVLMGYPLGKAQVLTHLFSSWEPVYADDRVAKFNAIYRSLGVELPPEKARIREADEGGLLQRTPWLAVVSMTGSRTGLIPHLRRRFSAFTIAFTGWAANPGFMERLNADCALPLSDHCDFQELVEFVDRCQPEKVYTFHGFSTELASHLRKRGYEAHAIPRAGQPLTDFLRAD